MLLFSTVTVFGQSQENNSSRQAAWNTFKNAEGGSWNIQWEERSGLPKSIYGGFTKTYQGNPETAARTFLTEYRALFSMRSGLGDLRHRRTRENRGVNHVIFDQYYEAIRVEGGEYRVHLQTDGRVDMANGSYYPDIEVPTTPSISSDDAIRAAITQLELSSHENLKTESELVIWPGDETYHLAWKLILFSEEQIVDWEFISDAHSGKELIRQNRITHVTGTGDVFPTHPGLPSVSSRSLYRLSGNGTLTGTYVKVENDDASNAYAANHNFTYSTSSTHFDEVNVYYHVDDFRHNYIANLGSLGFTQITAHLHSIHSHPSILDVNAWFSPSNGHLYFGDAASDTSVNNFAREDKVIYHEYGHAVIYDINSGISSSSNEEGAISEGTPDYFAGGHTERSIIGDYVSSANQRDMASPYLISYSAYQTSNKAPHRGGEFFSAVLWDLRGKSGISDDDADFLVFDALNRLSGNPNFIEFRNAMIAADNSAYSGAHATLIQNTFADWGIGTHVPPPAPSVSINTSGFSPELNWGSVSGATSYKIYTGTVAGSPGTVNCNSVSSFSLLDTTSSTTYTDYSVIIDPYESLFVCYYVIAVHSSSESNPSNKVGTHGMAPLKEIGDRQIPDDYSLFQNYPNPFNPSTTFAFGLPEEAHVSLKLYNMTGQLVASLMSDPMSAGLHEVNWQADRLPSGIYILQMQAVGVSGETHRFMQKLTLLK